MAPPDAGEDTEPLVRGRDVEMGPGSPWRTARNGHGSTPNTPNRQPDLPLVTSSQQLSTLEFLMNMALRSRAVTACLLYSLCSVSMILTNKSLTSSYRSLIPIDLNILLVVFQAFIAVACVEVCKRLRWIESPKVTLNTIWLWVPVNLFFCAMLFSGMASLQHNSVPMVTIFKNITNLLVATGDYTLFGATVEGLVFASFAVILVGAIAAAWFDYSENNATGLRGLAWMVANCLSTAGYVLYMKFATKNIKLSKVGMVYINNLLAMFILLPISYLRGEITVFLETTSIHTFEYFFKNALAGLTGFSLNFAALNCVATTGPTTYAVIGALNKIPVTFLGWVLFENKITPTTWFFILVSLCGGFLFSYAKYQSSLRRSRQEE